MTPNPDISAIGDTLARYFRERAEYKRHDPLRANVERLRAFGLEPQGQSLVHPFEVDCDGVARLERGQT